MLISRLCSICKLPLDVADEPLSADCGGDCWGCVGAIEAEMGDPESLQRVTQEVESGIRKTKFGLGR